jgi:hypothetical protein
VYRLWTLIPLKSPPRFAHLEKNPIAHEIQRSTYIHLDPCRSSPSQGGFSSLSVRRRISTFRRKCLAGVTPHRVQLLSVRALPALPIRPKHIVFLGLNLLPLGMGIVRNQSRT